MKAYIAVLAVMFAALATSVASANTWCGTCAQRRSEPTRIGWAQAA